MNLEALHWLDGEKSIISSCLRFPNLIDDAVEAGLKLESFFIPAHQILWKHITERHATGGAWDLMILCEKLESCGELKNVGGNAALTEVFYFASNNAHFSYHLERVIDLFTRRKLLNLCGEVSEEVTGDTHETAGDLLDHAEEKMMQLRLSSESKKEQTMQGTVLEVLDDLEAAFKGEPVDLGLQTGIYRADSLVGGLRGGDLFICAARPSMGKTAFLMSIIENLTISPLPGVDAIGALIYSLEMSQKQLIERLICGRGEYSLADRRKGTRPKVAHIKKIHAAASLVHSSNIVIKDTPGISIQHLRASARRAIRENPEIGVIAVDYIQLMRSESKQAQGNREREVAEISAGLKHMAKELNVPVIALAQLNRKVEERPDKRPRMSDLRESGSIEQDADVVTFLFRPAVYVSDEEEKERLSERAELIVGKNRNGETGAAFMRWIANRMTFTNADDNEVNDWTKK